MNFSKKIIVLLAVTIGLAGLVIYQINIIKDLKEIQNIYVEKTNDMFLYLITDTNATMEIAQVFESLGNSNSSEELWQDLELIKKADRDLNKWEREMIYITANADEKNISLDRKKSVGYDYVSATYMLTVSTDRQIEIANKVFSNNLSKIIVTLLYFVDPPRLTPETKSFFKQASSEFVALSQEFDTLKIPNRPIHERDSSRIKKRALDILESHLEQINSISSDFMEDLKPRMINPK
ncbi:hypothetical protein [Anaerosolibacter sp.]|uniref:hypothetical protein n=1 Tax=Anaerosolibacter sp. TaxID=1872527 RepID=UPI0039EE4FBC